jgi:hypothetical protein
MRQRYVYRDGRMVDRDGLPMLSRNEMAHNESQICAPMVMRDIPDYRSPIDGRWITTRSERREDLRRNNCVEADPPKRKWRLKNERFAAKRGLKLDPEICKDQNEAERHNRAVHDGKLRYENEPGRYASPSDARYIEPGSDLPGA